MVKVREDGVVAPDTVDKGFSGFGGHDENVLFKTFLVGGFIILHVDTDIQNGNPVNLVGVDHVLHFLSAEVSVGSEVGIVIKVIKITPDGI
jgi:hypothetical protein